MPWFERLEQAHPGGLINLERYDELYCALVVGAHAHRRLRAAARRLAAVFPA